MQLLPLICECRPLFDEICRRSLNFIRTCALHDSLLIRSVAQYGAIYARSQSIIGQNVLFCSQRYHQSISDVIYNPAHSFMNSFVYNSVDFETHIVSVLISDLCVRERAVYLIFSFILSLWRDFRIRVM